MQVLIQRQQQQAALQQQSLSLQEQDQLLQSTKHIGGRHEQQQVQLHLQQQGTPVLALDTSGSSAGSSSSRIHVGSRQQHAAQGSTGGSGRLACLSLALPIAQWK